MIRHRYPFLRLCCQLGALWALVGVAALSGTAIADVSDEKRRAVEPRGDLAPYEQANIELFERISPSVAYITSVTLRRDWYSLNIYEIPRGAGSGFVWDERGHIVTNFHVIEGSSSARVTLLDGSTWDAEVVGSGSERGWGGSGGRDRAWRPATDASSGARSPCTTLISSRDRIPFSFHLFEGG